MTWTAHEVRSPMMIHSPYQDALYLGDRPPEGYRPVADSALLIFAGLTGAGKSMAARLLQRNLDGHLLPDRRELTDLAILPLYSNIPVTDRIKRFQLTAHFRRDHPGGMAEILSRLATHPATTSPILLFDNLRGGNEIAHAAKQLPRAFFILAEAPAAVRLERLLTRGDAFDAGHDAGGELIKRLEKFTGPKAATHFREQIQTGCFDAKQLAEKLSILESEAENYSEEEMIHCLEDQVGPRLIRYNSAQMSPDGLRDLVLPLL